MKLTAATKSLNPNTHRCQWTTTSKILVNSPAIRNISADDVVFNALAQHGSVSAYASNLSYLGELSQCLQSIFRRTDEFYFITALSVWCVHVPIIDLFAIKILWAALYGALRAIVR